MAKDLEKVYDPKATEQHIYQFWEDRHQTPPLDAQADANKKP